MKNLFELIVLIIAINTSIYSQNNYLNILNSPINGGRFIIPNNNNINVTNTQSKTITFRIMVPLGTNNGVNFAKILSKNEPTVGAETGKFGIILGNAATTAHNDIRILTSSSTSSTVYGNTNVTLTSLNDGLWHHMALILNNSSGKTSFFFDGALVYTVNQPSAIDMTNIQNLSFGATNSGGSTCSFGLDEVRIWGKELSSLEINLDIIRIIDSKNGSTTPNLLAAYDFQTATFGNVPDITGKSLSGIVQVGTSGTNFISETSSLHPSNWNGSFSINWNDNANWNEGVVPNINSDVIIRDTSLNIPRITSNVIINSLTVLPSQALYLISKNLTITGTIHNTGTINSNTNFSLIQTDNVNNYGIIKYARNSTSVLDTDYIYWSSPVKNQDIGTISTTTMYGRYYSFDVNKNDWSRLYGGNIMKEGTGYAIRCKNGTPSGIYTANFIGIPNNGDIIINSIIPDQNYLIGNPYPSAINANTFLASNSSAINGTIYLWTHKTPIQLASNIPTTAGSGAFAYTSDDYAAYNGTGGVAASSGSAKPNGYISSCQGFFVSTLVAPSSNTITFSNAMRTIGAVSLPDGTKVNEQFFKPNESKSKIKDSIESKRIWLNLTNQQGAFKQILIGYVNGATNDLDNMFDGVTYDANEYIDFYSINNTKKLTIQGRATSFDDNDEVPLGYKTSISGEFTISIDSTDNGFSNQVVILLDKMNNNITNLKDNSYTFKTQIGTFDNRFTLSFIKKTLTNNDFSTKQNQIIISSKNQKISIKSNDVSIHKIEVHNLIGKDIYKNYNLNDNEIILENLNLNGLLILKIVLQNGNIITRKILNY